MARILILTVYLGLLWRIGLRDYRTRRIPDQLVIAIALLGIVSVPFMQGPALGARVLGMFAAGLPLFLCALIWPGSFGGGDIKLMAAAGIFLGWKSGLMALLLGIAGAGICSAVRLAAKKSGRKEQFALGPFLCVGIALACFWGEALWERLF